MRLNTLAGPEEIAGMQLPDVEDAAIFGDGPRTRLRYKLRFPAKVGYFR